MRLHMSVGATITVEKGVVFLADSHNTPDIARVLSIVTISTESVVQK
jgi:hypothetical protein